MLRFDVLLDVNYCPYNFMKLKSTFVLLLLLKDLPLETFFSVIGYSIISPLFGDLLNLMECVEFNFVLMRIFTRISHLLIHK